MPNLRPIATPFHRRWREFKIQYLPFVAFGLSVLAAAVLWREFALPRQVSGTNKPDQASCLQLNCDDYTPTDAEQSPWWTTFAQTVNATEAVPKSLRAPP